MAIRQKSRENWTQQIRKANLERVANYIEDFGGYSRVLNDMVDFERWLALQIGCSVKVAHDYIETVRGAQIFELKRKDGFVRE